MNILGIESSTKKLSIAISKKNRLLCQLADYKVTGFMRRIIPLIDTGLAKAGLKIKDIDIFSVNIGPGDFTGTRIGISVAKGFSTARGRPIFGIEGLDIFSVAIFKNSIKKIKIFLDKGYSVILLPVLDVRQDELLFSWYKVCDTESKKTIAKLPVGKVDYFIERAAGDNLVKSSKAVDFIKDSFLGQRHQLNNTLKNKGFIVFLGGTAFNSYKSLLPYIKKAGIDCKLNKKSLYPEAYYLNICTFYKVFTKIKKNSINDSGSDLSGKIKGDEPVLPLYIRDFIPFVKSRDS